MSGEQGPRACAGMRANANQRLPPTPTAIRIARWRGGGAVSGEQGPQACWGCELARISACRRPRRRCRNSSLARRRRCERRAGAPSLLGDASQRESALAADPNGDPNSSLARRRRCERRAGAHAAGAGMRANANQRLPPPGGKSQSSELATGVGAGRRSSSRYSHVSPAAVLSCGRYSQPTKPS